MQYNGTFIAFKESLTHTDVSVLQEENEVTEFFVTLEKDPQQEDFLQGRMPGNPYSSNEPGIGPLMRDIKNKICQDCDLVALLEDDSGMEVSCAFWALHFWCLMHLDILVLDFMKLFILLFDFHRQCLADLLMLLCFFSFW